MPMLQDMWNSRPWTTKGWRKVARIRCARPVISSLSRASEGDNDKFVAALSRHQVSLAHDALEAAGDLGQHLVAGVMPNRIVDVLEVVDVDEQHAETDRLAPRAVDLDFQPFVERHAIRQAGERIGHRQTCDAFLRNLLVCDIEHREHQPALQRDHRAAEPLRRALGTAYLDFLLAGLLVAQDAGQMLLPFGRYKQREGDRQRRRVLHPCAGGEHRLSAPVRVDDAQWLVHRGPRSGALHDEHEMCGVLCRCQEMALHLRGALTRATPVLNGTAQHQRRRRERGHESLQVPDVAHALGHRKGSETECSCAHRHDRDQQIRHCEQTRREREGAPSEHRKDEVCERAAARMRQPRVEEDHGRNTDRQREDQRIPGTAQPWKLLGRQHQQKRRHHQQDTDHVAGPPDRHRPGKIGGLDQPTQVHRTRSNNGARHRRNDGCAQHETQHLGHAEQGRRSDGLARWQQSRSNQGFEHTCKRYTNRDRKGCSKGDSGEKIADQDPCRHPSAVDQYRRQRHSRRQPDGCNLQVLVSKQQRDPRNDEIGQRENDVPQDCLTHVIAHRTFPCE